MSCLTSCSTESVPGSRASALQSQQPLYREGRGGGRSGGGALPGGGACGSGGKDPVGDAGGEGGPTGGGRYNVVGGRARVGGGV